MPTNKDVQYRAILAEAHEAGMAAGEAAQPVPMVVGHPTTLFGSDIDPAKPTYFVADGACGFAYIHVKGNTGFGRWCLKNDKVSGFRKSYYGGLQRSVFEFNQSLARKEDYARAFSDVLVKHGIDAYTSSRMD